eukprot:CAMPEP_0179228406 /NCGR_PEP_ID=MMETSP0797-20121207/9810_1 /TAXON_ID=47934 /ORGANISM="Dinophysis acuminata, Strain DAEP01" /LENGTH=388 /DNA_ID=CAMNT_0020935459 /DNA_START=179 /DNA_END=1342 /DNA_ORIENTATION=+
MRRRVVCRGAAATPLTHVPRRAVEHQRHQRVVSENRILWVTCVAQPLDHVLVAPDRRQGIDAGLAVDGRRVRFIGPARPQVLVHVDVRVVRTSGSVGNLVDRILVLVHLEVDQVPPPDVHNVDRGAGAPGVPRDLFQDALVAHAAGQPADRLPLREGPRRTAGLVPHGEQRVLRHVHAVGIPRWPPAKNRARIDEPRAAVEVCAGRGRVLNKVREAHYWARPVLVVAVGEVPGARGKDVRAMPGLVRAVQRLQLGDQVQDPDPVQVDAGARGDPAELVHVLRVQGGVGALQLLEGALPPTLGVRDQVHKLFGLQPISDARGGMLPVLSARVVQRRGSDVEDGRDAAGGKPAAEPVSASAPDARRSASAATATAIIATWVPPKAAAAAT